MSMKSAALAVLFTLACLPAMAQSTTSSTSAANAVTVNSTAVLATNPGTSTQNVHYSGTNSVYTTPSVQGSYFAGANPCLIGVGGGAAGGPVGFNFMIGRSDEGCTRRSDAAAWHALGLDQVAIARMCEDKANDNAMTAAGMVCPQDRPKVIAAAAPPVRAIPVAVTTAPPADYGLANFCRGLNPRNPQDQAYLQTDCKGQ